MGIFKDAKFGDKFKTRDGLDVIYLSSEPDRDRHGNLTGWTRHNVVVNINGIVPFEGSKELWTDEVSAYVERDNFAIPHYIRDYKEEERTHREMDIITKVPDDGLSIDEDDILSLIIKRKELFRQYRDINDKIKSLEKYNNFKKIEHFYYCNKTTGEYYKIVHYDKFHFNVLSISPTTKIEIKDILMDDFLDESLSPVAEANFNYVFENAINYLKKL